jgi:hypothetical protein
MENTKTRLSIVTEATGFQGFNLEPFTEPTIRTSLLVPQNWQLGRTEEFQLVCVGVEEQGFRANFAIAIDIVGEVDPPTLEEIGAVTLETIRNNYKDFGLHEEGEIQVDGRKAITRVFSWFEPAYNFKVMQRQTVIERGRNIYTVSATTLENLGTKYMPLMDKMLDSLTFN